MSRATTYRPEYCAMLVTHMAEGLSFESFASVIKSSKQPLYDWLKRHPEWAAAKGEGTEASRMLWEKIGINGMLGKIKGFNATVWIFNMKNRFGWGDNVFGIMNDEGDDMHFKLSYEVSKKQE